MSTRLLNLAMALAALGASGCAGFGVRVGAAAEPRVGAAEPRVGAADPPAGTAAAKAGAPEPRAGAPEHRAGTSEPTNNPRGLEAKENAAIESALKLVASKRAADLIGPGDLLEIAVYQEADLERKARVSPDGTITMPLIGEAKVAGMTVARCETALTQRLKRYLIEPHVSVFVREYGNKQVYVLGEVQKPGTFTLPMEAPLTVIEAVAMAGGFTPYAATDRTRIIRQKDGGSETILIEVSAITKRGDKSKDVLLEPNDVVFVPESFF